MEEYDVKVKDVFVCFFRDCNPTIIDTLYQNYGPYSPKTSIACCYMKCLVAISCWNEDAIEESYRYVKGTYKMLLKMQTEHQLFGTPIEKLSLRVLAAEALMLIALMKMAVKRCIKHYLKAGMNLRRSWKVFNAAQLRIVDLCENAGISTTKLDEQITEEIWDVDKVAAPATRHHVTSGEVEDSFLASFDLVEDIRSFFDSKDACISAIYEIKQLRIMSLFGYGLFHVILSLIPPTVLKIVNMLGFHGNRYLGISSLRTVSRSATNYRSILASVALLWYNLSLRPAFLSNPQHIASGVRQGEEVIRGGLGVEYSETWITLYFTGTIAKLQGNIEGALAKFQAAAVKAEHLRQCKLVAYYEIGWCHMILWNWTQASEIFLDLMADARWSKGFYGFLAAITMGASSSGDSVSGCSRAILSELPSRIKKTVNVELDSYCSRKSTLLHGSSTLQYECKVASLEMLYVWRCLTLSQTQAQQVVDMVTARPADLSSSTLACSYLLLGRAWLALELPQKAEQAFTISDTIIQPDPKDSYITVCVLSELAELYHSLGQEVKSREMADRAQSGYKGYDLENRLFNRIRSLNIN